MLPALVAATTTTAVPRVVGEPLPDGVVIGSGLALFVVIVVAGLWVRSRTNAQDREGDREGQGWSA